MLKFSDTYLLVSLSANKAGYENRPAYRADRAVAVAALKATGLESSHRFPLNEDAKADAMKAKMEAVIVGSGSHVCINKGEAFSAGF